MAEEHGAVRASDPDTSHAAAESINPSALQGVIIQILVEAQTGLTTHEIARLVHIGYQTITPRMKPMRLKGWVYDTGLRRAWKGGPGSPATNRLSIVWQLTTLRHVPIRFGDGITEKRPERKARKKQ